MPFIEPDPTQEFTIVNLLIGSTFEGTNAIGDNDGQDYSESTFTASNSTPLLLGPLPSSIGGAHTGAQSLYFFVPTGTNTGSSYKIYTGTAVEGERYYARLWIKTAGTNSNVPSANCMLEEDGGDHVDIADLTLYYPDWTRKSAVFTTTKDGYLYFTTSIAVENRESQIYLDDLMLINLTETFGADNIPDKEWCDSHIPDFAGVKVIEPVTKPGLYLGRTEIDKAYLGNVLVYSRKKPGLFDGTYHYTQIVGIQSSTANSGLSGYYATGINNTGDIEIVMDAYVRLHSGFGVVFSSRNSTGNSNEISVMQLAISNTFRFDYGATRDPSGGYEFTYPKNQRLVFRTVNGTLYINDTLIYTSAGTPPAATPQSLIYFGYAIPSGTGGLQHFYGNYYYFSIKKSGNYVVDAVPCMRSDDNSIFGFFNKVTNTYIPTVDPTYATKILE
jgi:hypothetical protein